VTRRCNGAALSLSAEQHNLVTLQDVPAAYGVIESLLVFINDQLAFFIFIKIYMIKLEFCIGRFAWIEVARLKKNVKMGQEDRKKQEIGHFELDLAL